ncbi:anthranilate phosphoribosyltransferase [Candidatus Roizmanbacteria bacterium CG_4_9_14_0_2_um_filter_39_13]|uniref:Anthranilate phosphoribosyltransferase n=2 Tax=Candidatus Roizmaniibacteriota TaxID=1752723 RepID=A0A2M8EWT6_9BACT|nr:MAG: anthranilate phosphoribosyltransferase [Candidatus Roizmanbacteria bacterium CG_4_10_14_0_2_um_filter_39_12]PJC30346.1 MAG: anthranilate phosphoribosyltransferase [Candidatus Roizmanbacteria bacterium CG_4_9_14_0_2_um_filter_39_13]PJE61401.1 MAG: anthranilate phosphoribosyltransferase [Candidatus Roizmanbacteria bacterium CG10_big_fil_rev_8_21_14_0_10_39_12]
MKNLTQKEAQQLIERMMSGEMSQIEMGKMLTDLAQKGETPDELIGAIGTLRSCMQTIQAPIGSVDTCGTGGDGKNTFNISTAVSLVVAGVGVPVVKHGNRKASSSCGSADVLEELGVNINLTPDQAKNVLETIGIVFLFAPIYHPAMKYVASVRKELGIRTIFNFLGPFCNPAKVRRQVVGVPNLEVLETLSHVAKELEYEYLALVTSTDGMDEISPAAPSYIRIIKNSQVSSLEIDPKKYGIHHPSIEDIIGGDVRKNVSMIQTVLNGEKGAPRDTILLNTAMALLVSGKAVTIEHGLELAAKSIDSGAAKHTLEALIHSSHNHEYS